MSVPLIGSPGFVGGMYGTGFTIPPLVFKHMRRVQTYKTLNYHMVIVKKWNMRKLNRKLKNKLEERGIKEKPNKI